MIKKFILASILSLSYISSFAQSDIPASTYKYKNGNGTLTINENSTFLILTFNSKGNTCELEGQINKKVALLIDDSNKTCKISFKNKSNIVEVSSDGDSCFDYCGANTNFVGKYSKSIK